MPFFWQNGLFQNTLILNGEQADVFLMENICIFIDIVVFYKMCAADVQ